MKTQSKLTPNQIKLKEVIEPLVKSILREDNNVPRENRIGGNQKDLFIRHIHAADTIIRQYTSGQTRKDAVRNIAELLALVGE